MQELNCTTMCFLLYIIWRFTPPSMLSVYVWFRFSSNIVQTVSKLLWQKHLKALCSGHLMLFNWVSELFWWCHFVRHTKLLSHNLSLSNLFPVSMCQTNSFEPNTNFPILYSSFTSMVDALNVLFLQRLVFSSLIHTWFKVQF